MLNSKLEKSSLEDRYLSRSILDTVSSVLANTLILKKQKA